MPTQTHIALLRGINVGGNILKMRRLLEIWDGLGFKNARTYVQSGNIVFEASRPPVAEEIEKRLMGETRLPVSVILRSAVEWGAVAARNPFLAAGGVDVAKLHVTFLAEAPKPAGLEKLAAIRAGQDEFRVSGKHVYLHCPNGYGRTKLSNNAIEKALGIKATTRNWNTVIKLWEMAGA